MTADSATTRQNKNETSGTIAPLADAIMRGVVASGVVTNDNIQLSLDVMRGELKSFLWGDEYVNERGAILAGSPIGHAALQSVVLSCVLKIRGA